jgi:hypothetical protein
MEMGEILILKRRINELCNRPAPGRRFGLGGTRRSSRSPLNLGHPIALGASPGRHSDDYKLAVHLQDYELTKNRAFLDALNDEARGDAVIKYVGEILPSAMPWQRTQKRPLLMGTSVGIEGRDKVGTIGFFATDHDKSVVLISNNHVLSANNTDTPFNIIQPGAPDKGQMPDDWIGQLKKCVPIQFVSQKNVSNPPLNYVDAAYAQLRDNIKYDPSTVASVGKFSRLHIPCHFIQVEKMGRTTGHTVGKIVDLRMGPYALFYPGFGWAWFDEQFAIESPNGKKFSDLGDSGSLIVDASARGVGLLFGVSGSGLGKPVHQTYANPLYYVIEALGLPLDNWANPI